MVYHGVRLKAFEFLLLLCSAVVVVLKLYKLFKLRSSNENEDLRNYWVFFFQLAQSIKKNYLLSIVVVVVVVVVFDVLVVVVVVLLLLLLLLTLFERASGPA